MTRCRAKMGKIVSIRKMFTASHAYVICRDTFCTQDRAKFPVMIRDFYLGVTLVSVCTVSLRTEPARDVLRRGSSPYTVFSVHLLEAELFSFCFIGHNFLYITDHFIFAFYIKHSISSCFSNRKKKWRKKSGKIIV